MSSKSERQNRKKALKQVRANEAERFLQSLPIDKQIFKDLFDYLDENLGEDDCNNDMTMTLKFLTRKGIEDRANVIQWLHDNGAYCDCEVLANVEQEFDEKVR